MSSIHSGVREPGGGSRLASEAGGEVGGLPEDLGAHDLQRDVPAKAFVRGAIDGRHPAARDQLADDVPTIDDAADERIDQGPWHGLIVWGGPSGWPEAGAPLAHWSCRLAGGERPSFVG
jgi:hypothetical protein